MTSPAPFPFERLSRRPDVEGPDLVASDAADRLILDESADLRAAAPAGSIAVIGDTHGALALAAAHDGARDVRVHQDALAGERAISRNAAELGLDDRIRLVPLDADALRDARVVLLRLPRALDALRDIAALIAAHASPAVVVVAGGRVKHMTLAMNDVLGENFGRLDVSHARQKSRVLFAREPRAGHEPVPAAGREGNLEIRAFGGAFAGARLDHGTRLLLAHLPDFPAGGSPEDPLIDFACGTGAVAAHLALRHPAAAVYASDQSAAAVASARATAAANGVAERVEVVRDDVLTARPEASASFIALNPPFHSGAALTERLAFRLFADASRVLRPGGELWCVWNSGMRYRGDLERLVGPTRQVTRDAKFTVTVSTRR
ncbi:methyltransferase domain-containing protein [Microbacterium oleivorans]|uniref:16S RNA methylase RsmC n=1 Tax=Microbacterium oleivorans TaxID=273677 RepID=A0A031FPU4_9MICO|nr:methyltransferase [Microbacterium oleivorans]AZS44282.1 Ribosomal RNA large subunit methyltransferase G [Microbacterium oleivorans]EZP26874.1 16S RNA methylase RsmC [Microbacterium oleivorans]THE07712.1 methyltransferase domain-containing protein [Microbacterium oleivorans]